MKAEILAEGCKTRSLSLHCHTVFGPMKLAARISLLKKPFNVLAAILGPTVGSLRQSISSLFKVYGEEMTLCTIVSGYVPKQVLFSLS